MRVSKLHIHSLGIVAVNKPLDTHDIEVAPIEDLPFLDGELTDNAETTKLKGTNAAGGSYATTAITSATLTATWMPFGSNRKTAPDVRRGEKVLLWRFADEDKFYWSEFTYQPKLRKLETVVFMISATRTESDPGTPQSTYYLEVSSHTKTITLHTSKADGEPFTYDLQINAKDGNWTFTDDIGNFITVDSLNRRIELQNTDGSHIDMDRKDIRIYAPNNIELRADNDILMSAGNKINSQAGSSINDKAPSINTESDKTTNTVPLTSFSGDVKVAGMTTSKGLTSTSGGAFSVAGGGTFSGTVNVNKLISTQSISAPNV